MVRPAAQRADLGRDHPAAGGLAGQLLVGWSSDRTGERRLHGSVPIYIGAVALGCTLLIPASLSFNARLVLAVSLFTVALMGLKAYMPAFWALPSLLLTEAAAAGSIGLINSVGNLGGFVGPSLLGYLENRDPLILARSPLPLLLDDRLGHDYPDPGPGPPRDRFTAHRRGSDRRPGRRRHRPGMSLISRGFLFWYWLPARRFPAAMRPAPKLQKPAASKILAPFPATAIQFGNSIDGKSKMSQGLVTVGTGLVRTGGIGRDRYFKCVIGTSAGFHQPVQSSWVVILMPDKNIDADVVKDIHSFIIPGNLGKETQAKVHVPGDRSVEVLEMPNEVRDFCAEKQINDAVKTAIFLAREHFAIIGEPVFEVVNDPEYSEHYVGIHVQVEGRPEEVFQQSKAYLDSFRASIDPQKRIFVNVIYHSMQQ